MNELIRKEQVSSADEENSVFKNAQSMSDLRRDVRSIISDGFDSDVINFNWMEWCDNKKKRDIAYCSDINTSKQCFVKCLSSLNGLTKECEKLNLNCYFNMSNKVDVILNHRNINGKTDYLVQWKNYNCNTWESDKHISGCQKLISYNKQLKGSSSQLTKAMFVHFLHDLLSVIVSLDGHWAYDRYGRVQLNPGRAIYECNSKCKCGISCYNRVVQHGQKVKVGIFKTSNGRGWGLKTLESIAKGQFVLEYLGEIITTEEAEKRDLSCNNNVCTYLFDLDFGMQNCKYTIDARHCGNASHFMNHSCDPNLQVFAVWIEMQVEDIPG
ncbi:histone-lysine N-methyltransferase Su(var)3-9 [Caerostris extrusa]|uniref:Histone-lysine N-methyltransferase Su(Var)3-9 n=1 Tax=Caerostris extrusa TaxID=172846 RepID=A0AAV4SNN2_CAEEX|nr:histone-lysine N-methyltransferase Su(var)3-9 [Caerostris extrusa]